MQRYWTYLTIALLDVSLLFVLYRADYDKYSEDPEFKPASRHVKDPFEEVRFTPSNSVRTELLLHRHG